MTPVVPAPLRRPLLALAVLATLTACSSDELDVDGFAPGACTEAAPTLQDVDETLRLVADEQIEPQEAGERLRAAQASLKGLTEGADEPVATGLTEVVTRAGFFRIAVDSNNYDGSQVAEVRGPLDDLVEQCNVE